MMPPAVRRKATLSLRLALLAALVSMPLVALSAHASAATPPGPVVDVVEIAGVIDRPIAKYAIEQIQDAERRHDTLLVFQVDSLGGLKISDDQIVPPLVRRIQ